MRTHWIQELRWPEIEAQLTRSDVALVPVGATEQHGRHLPLQLDTGWAISACEYAARQCDCLIAPPLQVGWSPHHMGYPGSLTLSASTLEAIVYDICTCLIHHGFHHVVMVNGNRIANLQPMEIAAVRLQNRSGAKVAVADTGLIARREVAALCKTLNRGLEHAAEVETSFALHWCREHVDMDAAKAPAPVEANGISFDYPVEIDPARNGNAASRFVTPSEHFAATQPDGLGGDPTLASATAGAEIATAIGMGLVRFIDEFRQLEVGNVNVSLPV